MSRINLFLFIVFQNISFLIKGIYYTWLVRNSYSNKKISVIIPTMYKSSLLTDLIHQLNNSEQVLEIILIDNANKNGSMFTSIPKVKVFNQINNIYVNPSWNLGVTNALSDYVLICNDDLLFDLEILKKIQILLDKNIGLIGVSLKNNETSKFLKIRVAKMRYDGYGTLMFLNKKNYKIIPDDLLVWSGDDYLFYAINKVNLEISGFYYKTEMATTSGLSPFNEIKIRDRKTYIEKYQYKLGNTVYIR